MSALAALVRAYERMAARGEVPAFGFSQEKIGFLICLDATGMPVGAPIDLRQGTGNRRVAGLMAVPQPGKRTSAIAPNFLWDKTAYTLGVTAGAGRRVAQEHEAFAQRHRAWLGGSDDAGLRAFLGFIAWWRPPLFAELGWPQEMMDHNVVFALDRDRAAGLHLHDRPAAREAWARLCLSDDRPQGLCLITGRRGPVARLHPTIKGVWGAQSSGASIVSFNLDAFTSYGHEQGDNAPISEAAAFAYCTALNHFLEPDSGHRIQIGDASTVFWAEAEDSAAAAAAEAFTASVFGLDDTAGTPAGTAALEAFATGALRAVPEGVRLHVIGLAPNAARLSLRFYVQEDFAVILHRFAAHHARLRILPGPKDAAPSMWRLLVETAVLRKSENIQPNLAGEWMRAILTGAPYPLTLLSSLITRLRADHDVNALRVAILKSILIKNFRMEAPMSLDHACKDSGYLLGRLFAVYEQIQLAALGPGLHATVKDKFYGTASAQPRKVFPYIDSSAVNHLARVGKHNPARRFDFERQIGGIMELMAPGENPFPVSLPDRSQALFALGYYHQRHDAIHAPADMPFAEAAE
ncbi:type I-C CRISPR-associated protein Cas8c/Csd1 [Xanthobacter agilis]|uniref:CRISPR-associated protein Csd1 n=1 Tax=Xanthobacter agilis TaxID=47492 RepID=A0ABU0LGG7_XANAG|nr:type I-C CRISPR-associated protein Cas8c/Csd1 [Xanthobacter agilis]MDQ0506230.1 CRISPR-associated protein Csd1 [Xanthobacter agilis]